MRRTTTVDGYVAKINGHTELSASPKTREFLRRTSSAARTSDRDKKPMKPEMREYLKHLGPSNLASRPRQTRYNTVKIKPGSGPLTDGMSKASDASSNTPRHSTAAQDGIGAGLLSCTGKDAKDGVLALQPGYGTIPSGSTPSPKKPRKGSLVAYAETSPRGPQEDRPTAEGPTLGHKSSTNSQSSLGSLHSGMKSPDRRIRINARSGSITENIIDMGGIKKTVLETTSSSEDPEDGARIQGDGPSDEGRADKENNKSSEPAGKKKRRRKKRKGGRTDTEDTPLLGENQ